MQHFRVVALGLPGAGKTIYLSTLHHETIENLAPGIFLTVPLDERKRLTRIFDMAADAAVSWPEATRPNERMHETRFTCSVASPRAGAIRLLEFSYVDYAGEWLTEPGDGSSLDQALQEQIGRADVLLGVIDGRRLLDYLTGEIPPKDFFYRSVRPVAEHMRAFPGPIHFLISKWDLLEDYTLAEIRGRLFDSDDARWLGELVRTQGAPRGPRRRRSASVRLIPVSSMGDFVYLDEEGRTKKKAGRSPRPRNVEIPLVAVIPDLVRLVLAAPPGAQSGDGTSQAGEPGSPATRITSAGEAADAMLSGGASHARTNAPLAAQSLHGGGLLGSHPGLRMAAMVAVMIGVPVGRTLGRAGTRAVRRTRRRYRKVRATELSRVKNYETGMFYVLHHITARLNAYDAEHPDSLLS